MPHDVSAPRLPQGIHLDKALGLIVALQRLAAIINDNMAKQISPAPQQSQSSEATAAKFTPHWSHVEQCQSSVAVCSSNVGNEAKHDTDVIDIPMGNLVDDNSNEHITVGSATKVRTSSRSPRRSSPARSSASGKSHGSAASKRSQQPQLPEHFAELSKSLDQQLALAKAVKEADAPPLTSPP